jgi:hypothetical protein
MEFYVYRLMVSVSALVSAWQLYHIFVGRALDLP